MTRMYAYRLQVRGRDDAHAAKPRPNGTWILACGPIAARDSEQLPDDKSVTCRSCRGRLWCPQGHPWTPENTAHYSGSRCCVTCNRESARESQRRRREAGAP